MEPAARRSGNYEPSICDDSYVQSLTSPYAAKEYEELAVELKMHVESIMNETGDELDQLELIDDLQRLGISYHFTDGIRKILDNIHLMITAKFGDAHMQQDLYASSLKFRLLRQHGYHVPQEIFCTFMDDEGNFNTNISDDIRGVLSLYEASFLSMEGESILDTARSFAAYHLKKYLGKSTELSLQAEKVRHALELPLHWRVQKLEAKWFIQAYTKNSNANLTLVKLAKLDFNIVQAMYQEEVKQLSSWYTESGLPEKLTFARHRLVEVFLWAVGIIPEPHFKYTRKILTKIGVLITILDDMYDVYGTLDELKLFTDAIERWEINTLDCLPEYMRIFFLAIFNFANEVAYDSLKNQGLNIVPNLKEMWAGQSKAYYLEAKWYHEGYFPSLDEYLNTAWISISGPLVLFHAYITTANPTNTNELKILEQENGIIFLASMLIRLLDDLGTTSGEIQKGNTPTSIQCCMNETGRTEDEARGFIKDMIDETLKKMNKEILMESTHGKSLLPSAMNLARVAQCFYQSGDGFGVPDKEVKENFVSLLVEPIQMQIV